MHSYLFRNATVLLSGERQLRRSMSVLVHHGIITAVTNDAIDDRTAAIIDVRGKTLMPGLIDAHAHVTGLSLSPKNLTQPASEIAVAAAHYLRSSLMMGFTTIREAGGADYVLARLLKEAEIVGPRLFYSGKALTQTGGGADFRTPIEVTDPCGHVSPMSVMSVITDGIDEVRRAAREELRKGATQLKAFASGGVVFPAEGNATRYEFSEPELAAIVEEAAARGTYVMAHAYTDESVRRCLGVGVRSIEHGNFVTRDTVARMRDAGAFLDPTFISLVQRVETAGEMRLSDEIVTNLKRTIERGKEVYSWAKELQVPIALGTDLWGPEAQKSQIRELEIRAQFDSADEILGSATTVNAELLLQRGKLGVIAPGAHADLLIVDGDPLSDVRVLLDPERNLKLIMKDGVIYKNDLTTALGQSESAA